MSKYTSAPWRVTTLVSGRLRVEGDQRDGWVPVADVFQGIAPMSEGGANARLIAAAPELLAACRAARLELTTVGVGHGHTHSQVVCDQLGVAILKAEGR